MVIKINYTSSDIYVSTNVSPVYVVVNYSGTGGGGGAAVWGGISGTLSDQLDLQAALDAKVPYTGAIADVDLGEHELKAGQVEFDQTPTGTAGVGVMRWNDADGTVDLGLKGGNVTLQVGQEQVLRVVNKTGADLLESQYRAVRIRLVSEGGAQGQRLAVVLAQGNNDPDSTTTIGIVTENIANNQEGFITTSGEVRGINTTGSLQGETWADGDIIYLSPTVPGGITIVKPIAPNHMVVLGYVIYAHAINGKIFTKVDNGYELGELHDVYVPTPSNNDGIFWNTANSRYQNNSIAGVLGYTPTSGSGVTGQVAYWNGTNSQTGSNNLFWDAANSRLGIGTNAPGTTLDVSGNIWAKGTTPLLALIPSGWGGQSLLMQSGVTQTGSGVGNYSIFKHDGSSKGWAFAQGSSICLQIAPAGNVSIGSVSDGGQRLQVYGDAYIKGSGNTSATSALLVQNSGSGLLFSITNNGTTTIRGTTAFDGDNAINVTNNANTSIFNVWNSGYVFVNRVGGTARFQVGSASIEETSTSVNFGLRLTSNFTSSSAFSGYSVNFTNPQSITSTGGETFHVNITATLAPTSGGSPYTSLRLNPTINQTGGANGITRGLYVNPTLTAAADWRSIEWSNNSGWGLYGSGTANNFLNGRLGIGTNTPANPLHISQNINGSLYARISNPSNGNQALAGFYLTNNLNVGAAFYITSSTYTGGIANTAIFTTDGSINGGLFFQTGNASATIRFASGTGTEHMRLFPTGNLVLQNGGTFSDANQRLQVQGTTLLNGQVTNSGGFLQNGNTVARIENTGNSVPTGSTGVGLELYQFSSISYIQSYNRTTSANAPLVITASTMNVIAKLLMTAGTTSNAQINLESSIAPTSPVNGDIWFDGTDLKMRIGGVTKTFTLI